MFPLVNEGPPTCDTCITAEERMRRATRKIARALRQEGHDHDTIQARITDGITAAFQGGVLLVDPGGDLESIEVLTSPGVIFRLVLDIHGIDRADQRARERWLSVVLDELRVALAE